MKHNRERCANCTYSFAYILNTSDKRVCNFMEGYFKAFNYSSEYLVNLFLYAFVREQNIHHDIPC